MTTTIDCREAVRRMWSYLSHSLEEADSAELEAHLDVCQRCCGELEFSRELRDRVSAVETERMPLDVRAKVDEVLRQGTTDPAGSP
jgi:anti-sigma factor (TIGR02949 family)